MSFKLLAISFLGLFVCSFGCNYQGSTGQEKVQVQNGVAVIDLDAIAVRLGRNVKMDNELKEKKNQLNRELSSQQSYFETEFNQTKKEFGEQPTKEQNLQLQDKLQKMKLALGQSKQAADKELVQLRTQLISRFREEVIPVARQVAAESGRDVVVTKNTNVIFAISPTADITDRVVEMLLNKTPSSAANLSNKPSHSGTSQR